MRLPHARYDDLQNAIDRDLPPGSRPENGFLMHGERRPRAAAAHSRHRKGKEGPTQDLPAGSGGCAAGLSGSSRTEFRFLPEENKGIIGISNVVQIDQPDIFARETVMNGVEGQLVRGKRHRPFTVLDVGKALFLRGGNHFSVLNQTGGRIMIGGIDAEGIHRIRTDLSQMLMKS